MTVKPKTAGKNISLRMILIVVVIIVCIVVLVSTALKRRNKNQEESALVQAGIDYLLELESGDAAAVSDKINSIQKEKYKALLESDESAVWSAFNNSIIIGDSRAVGFYYYELLPEERVLARSGGIITDVQGYLYSLKLLQPEMVFLCFGLNDIGYWSDTSDYADVYSENVELLKETLPNTEIYVTSILPAVGVGLSKYKDYPRIGEYNEALQAMCEEKGYNYIDNTQEAEDHEDLYEADGLHLQKGFYIYWAINIITEAYDE